MPKNRIEYDPKYSTSKVRHEVLLAGISGFFIGAGVMAAGVALMHLL